ncbi:MAG: aspartate--tRNA(Asn) ligase, partial [Chlamydiia bacterium]|nr:aspartate--tRNA(Asn) ligase [Chlamydiia bacterium]
HTTRHLTEGKQFEFEIGFFDHWHEVLDVLEECLKFMLKHLRTVCLEEIALLGDQMVSAPADIPFPRITFQEAQQIYFERTGVDERQELDLCPAAEKELCKWAREKHGTDFVFVIDWKTTKRPFYAYPNDDNPELSNTFDLLCGGVEVTSGGQRRHTFDSMVEGIKAHDLDPADFEDYLSIFKFGMPPHGGFGLGLERFTMTLLQLPNIREASLFPSDPKRIASARLKANIVFGGEEMRNEIIRLAKQHQVDFTHLVHEPAPTADDSSKIRGTRLEDGVKALILKGKTSKKNYQINIPCHRKLDMKAVSQLLGEKCEFEKPEAIEERFGLTIGGIPPFGNLLNIDTY